MTKEQAAVLVVKEFERACLKFPAMRSPHEGLAILEEEVDELKREVRHGPRDRMRAEATQVAAMALRFLVDLCDAEAPESSGAKEGASTEAVTFETRERLGGKLRVTVRRSDGVCCASSWWACDDGSAEAEAYVRLAKILCQPYYDGEKVDG